MDALRKIADAVLYEGYVLWPYNRSATKNQRRWTFGGVYPRSHSEAHPDDRAGVVTQCLVEGSGDPRIDVGLRFLHVVERRVRSGGAFVDEVTVEGERYVAWDEATERESRQSAVGSRQIDIPAGESEEQVADRRHAGSDAGESCGANSMSPPSSCGLGCTASPCASRTRRRSRATARRRFARRSARRTSSSRSKDSEFVSLTDPPEELRAEAEACSNEGLWPVLVGAEGERHTLLASPIILSDYPQIAPESPGDLFDGGEIDQLLILNILSLTDEEKEEMRAADPRTREILERTESLSEEELMRLHGAIREFGMARSR